MPNQALKQTRDNVLRYGEVVGCELLNLFVRQPMFFRIWFLYVSKVGHVAVVLAGFGAAFPRIIPHFVFTIVMWILGPLALISGLIAIVLMFKKTLACPFCRRQGTFFMCGRIPGIDCGHCGLVKCEHPLTSFKLTIEPWDDNDSIEPA